jgi:hypothetical protein
MYQKGESLALQILGTAAVIGLIVALWFWDASHFIGKGGSVLNTTYKSYLPNVCTILVDRAGEPKKSAQYYAWGASTRIDLEIIDLDNKKTVTHSLISPGGITYLWQDGIPSGDIERGKRDYTMIQNVAPNNSWFCFPWLFYDHSKFSLPKGVTFNDK